MMNLVTLAAVGREFVPDQGDLGSVQVAVQLAVEIDERVAAVAARVQPELRSGTRSSRRWPHSGPTPPSPRTRERRGAGPSGSPLSHMARRCAPRHRTRPRVPSGPAGRAPL